MRKDREADYALPTGRGLDILDQRVQLKPHEGFAPEAIHLANPMRLEAGDGPVSFFWPEPPAWMRDGNCVDDWELFDDPDAATFHRVVKPLCDSCPVKDLCLAYALEHEVPEGRVGVLGANWRAGVWGGLRPPERVRLQAGLPPRACGKGHDMRKEGNAYYATGSARWQCVVCNKARKAARKQRERAAA